jgi:hypothetical protein
MRTIIWKNKIDKSEWARGPWTDEPDAMQWSDPATGLPCLIVRAALGNLCGYVGVTPGHPAYGVGWAKLNYTAHGGINFAESCSGEPGTGVCHLPSKGEPDKVWWIGFDCAHGFDVLPFGATLAEGIVRRTGRGGRGYDHTYKDIEYVKRQCARLAQQLDAHAKREARGAENRAKFNTPKPREPRERRTSFLGSGITRPRRRAS